MEKILFFSVLAFFSFASNAAEFSGKVQSIAAGPNLGSIVLVRVEGHSPTASWAASGCTNGFWSFKFDSSTAGGKETYSLLLAAYAAKSSVVINGTGTCSGQPEQIQSLGYARFEF